MILFVNATENKSLVWEPGMVAWTVEQPASGEPVEPVVLAVVLPVGLSTPIVSPSLGVDAHDVRLEGGGRAQGGEDQLGARARRRRQRRQGGACQGEVWRCASSKGFLNLVGLVPSLFFERKDVN